MGCGDSKGLTAKETTINNKIAERNIAKKEESKVGVKKLNEENEILPENNDKKDIQNKTYENNEYKDKINLIYFSYFNVIAQLFGENFVKNNKDNIYLIINGKQSELIYKCNLNKGNNTVTIVIKNKLTDLSHMLENYSNTYLKDISELKYLDVSQTKNFYEMFSGLKLTDINFLRNWKVSNGIDFGRMFSNSRLKDKKL